MSTVSVKKGEIIFKAGDVGASMFEVSTGKVGIYANYGETGEKCLIELEAGGHFGEMSVIEDLPRSATAIALEDTVMDKIDKEDFADFIKLNPSVATEIMKNLSGRLRALTGDYMDACKTLSEVMNEDNKPKKMGLWEKIKKYAAVYAETVDQAYGHYEDSLGIRTSYLYESRHFPMY